MIKSGYGNVLMVMLISPGEATAPGPAGAICLKLLKSQV